MAKCADCGKEVSKDQSSYCDMCGSPLCKECGNLGLCLSCDELWEAEIDLNDVEAEGEF